MPKYPSDGHFDAANPKNRRPPKPPVWAENDGRAPDTIAALAAVENANVTGSAPPSSSNPPHTHLGCPKLLLFDNGMEIWFRAFSRWTGDEQAVASPAMIDGDRELGLGQAKARYAIFTRWQLYEHPGSYGCSTTWMDRAIRDSDTSDDVQLQFGVGHLLAGTCAANHSSHIPMGTIQPFLRLNLFDLRIARDKHGATTSLTQYFATATPRISGGNHEGGTTVVHSLPAPFCDHPDCEGMFASITVNSIETLWPKILHINPETGAHPRPPLPRSFNIDDGAGNSIVYELIGTISHNAGRKHWTSKFLIDNTTFHYDDLVRGGSLVLQGKGELISVPDHTAVLWAYHRSSSVTEVRLASLLLVQLLLIWCQSKRSFRETVLNYEKAFAEDSRRPPPPAIELDETPPPEALKVPTPTPNLNAIAAAPPILAPFPVDGPPPGPTLPELAHPSEWCPGCHRICDHASGEVPVIRCNECGFWYHVKCALDISPHLDPNSDAWLCIGCDGFDLRPDPAWSDVLLGTYIMFKTSPQSAFYPARVAGLTSTDAVRMEWYKDNIYDRTERPLESEFVTTKADCAKHAAADADLTYESDNVGCIKWPLRLTEDAGELHNYTNPAISATLLVARQPILDIITGSLFHPIVPDYDLWMASAQELKAEKHANDFARKFFSAAILLGDASLIDPHTEYVLQALSAGILPVQEAVEGCPIDLRRRAIIIAPLLFQLAILRMYLRRTPTDDEQIYYLTRSFDQAELQALHPDDPFAGAKRGKVIRNMTVPEIVLQAAESSIEAENIPRRWCHIGTRISKAADARIPPSFVLANAFDAHGQDYTWIHSNIPGISHPLLPSLSEVPKSRPSSPLSDIPMDMEVELALEEPKQHANKPGNKKRKREKAEIGVEITPQAVQAHRPQLRRSARTHKPRK
ncbi:hypothetical protein B0H13DRAFT_1870985 [Mycena leptocephala]|nr:hypothetical protein B0H13DRAFT_1870985 [Mycena leptocephala]